MDHFAKSQNLLLNDLFCIGKVYTLHLQHKTKVMLIQTMAMYKGLKLIENLKWGVKDREMCWHGAYPNRGHHGRYLKIRLTHFIKQK